MIVTDLQYFLEKRLVKKLDIMIKRCEQDNPRKDALLICEGGEGEGKTNSSVAIAYYIKHNTKRDIHLLFRLNDVIKLAQSTQRKIIIWDEPALDSLSTDWYKESNKNLIRLLMTVRKKRHFLIFNLTKFYKFSDYIVVDRGLGLIHMYSRDSIIPGRFQYVGQKRLDRLYQEYRRNKKKLYKKLASFNGNFTNIEKHFNNMGININNKPNATYDDYEQEKDLAINSIGNETTEVDKNKRELKLLRYKIAKLKYPINTRVELAKQWGVTHSHIAEWGRSKEISKIENEKLGLGGVDTLVSGSNNNQIDLVLEDSSNKIDEPKEEDT